MRGSPPQQLAELPSRVTVLRLGPANAGQDRINFSTDQFQVSQISEIHHSDLLARLSAALHEKCHCLSHWTGLLKWERHTQTFLQFPIYQQHLSSESATLSPLWSRQSQWLQKEPTWMEHQGRHQAREADRALKNAPWISSIQTREYRGLEDSLFAQKQVCNYKQDTNTATWYFLDFVYPSKLLETQKYSHPCQCRKPQLLIDNAADYL